MRPAPKNAKRRGLMAKIHIAKKQLGLNDVRYRSLLEAVTGKDSCSLMSDDELEHVLEAFKKQGFKTHHKPKKTSQKTSRIPMAQDSHSKKIRALWLNLYNLGAIQDPSEEKLTAFAKRMTQVSALHWLDSAQADIVIKALRGWLERVGYAFPDAEFQKICTKAGQAENIALLNAQMRILGMPIQQELIVEAANRLKLGDYNHILLIPVPALQKISHDFAQKIRKAQAKL